MQESNNIRLATDKDIKGILSMAQEFFSASPYSKYLDLDQDKAELIIKELILSQPNGTGVILVIDTEDGLGGCLAATITETLFSRDKIANEVVWWVNPNIRNSKAGAKLIEGYLFWANLCNCKFISLSTIEALDPEHKIQDFIISQGFTPTENSFLKAIN